MLLVANARREGATLLFQLLFKFFFSRNVESMMNDLPGMRRFANLVFTSAGVIPELDVDGGESLDYRLDGVGLAFSKDEDKYLGEGELFITSKRVIWINRADESTDIDKNDRKVFDFDVPYIILHAISRDPESYPIPCLYCQLDKEEEDFIEKSECEEGEEKYDTGEVFFIPRRRVRNLEETTSLMPCSTPSLTQLC